MFLNLRFALLRRPLVVWLAVLMAVFGALAPTLSHALAAPAWAEVCTPTGMRWLMLDAAVQTDAAQNSADSPQPPEPAFSLVHCPFCLLSTDRAAPAPHALVHLFAVSGAIKVPTVRQAFLFIPHFALKPPPRGPPDSL